MKVLRRRSNPSQLATFVYTWRGKLEKWRIDDRKVEFNAAARSRRPVGPARKRLALSMRRRIGKRTRRWKKKRKRKNTRALDDRSTWTHRRENLFYGLSRNLEIRARLRAKLVRRIAISRVPRNFPPAWNVETFEEEDGRSRGLRTWVAAMAGFTAAERERERGFQSQAGDLSSLTRVSDSLVVAGGLEPALMSRQTVVTLPNRLFLSCWPALVPTQLFR